MKLQICEQIITSHHFYALPLSIIGSGPKLKPWLYSEFIQIYTRRNREDEKVEILHYNKGEEMFTYEPLHDAFIAPKWLYMEIRLLMYIKLYWTTSKYI